MSHASEHPPLKLNFHHQRPGWSALQLRTDARAWATQLEYSAQWATALTEAAVSTGFTARTIDDEVWAQLGFGGDHSVVARKKLLCAVIAALTSETHGA